MRREPQARQEPPVLLVLRRDRCDGSHRRDRSRRSYWSHRRDRSRRSYWSHRRDRCDGSHRRDRSRRSYWSHRRDRSRRSYWSHRRDRSRRSYWSHRSYRRDRSHWSRWTWGAGWSCWSCWSRRSHCFCWWREPIDVAELVGGCREVRKGRRTPRERKLCRRSGTLATNMVGAARKLCDLGRPWLHRRWRGDWFHRRHAP